MTIKPRFKKTMNLADMQAEDLRVVAASKGKGINKSATLIKAGVAEGDSAGAFSRPNEEQLAKINMFTRRPKTADQLYVFNTLSMNDLADRDDDVFTTETVKAFAALPQPFSPIGKSYMVDHEYKTTNARGRIFDTDTQELDTDLGKATFLRNSIYIPDTPQYADFIEAQDFGIMWAVSVGVTLGATECSVCDEPFSSWGYWCRNGHDKGLSYDPTSTETDDWGYPLAIDPSDPKAVKCLRKFLDPQDFYELSQVFLGAQYFAALDKTAGFSTAKTAGGFLSVPSKVAKEIEFSHEPEKVQEARKKFSVSLDADGMIVWEDEQGIGWTYDPLGSDSDKVLCTGRTEKDADDEIEDDNDEEVNSDGRTTGSELGDSDPEGDDEAPEPDEGSGEGGDSSEDGSEVGGGAVPVADSDASPEDSEDDESDETEVADDTTEVSDSSEDDDSGSEGDDDEEKDAPAPDSDKAVSKATDTDSFIALLPESLRPSAGKQPADVVKALEGHIKALEVKAALGDEFLVQLRADALSWYTRANMQPGDRGVKTASFEKLLDRVSDDPSLLREIIEEQKEVAQKRFPARARRSSKVPDVNEPPAPDALSNYESSSVDGDESDKVRKRHGLSE